MTTNTTPYINITPYNISTTPESANAPTTKHTPAHNGLPNDDIEIIIIVICIVAVIALLVLMYTLYKKLRYSKSCVRLKNLTRRRSSTTGSHHPLEPDEVEDLPPPRTERELFSIGDHDDIDTRLGGAPDDGYFFDEIYEKSAFVDEVTNSSLKELRIPTESDNVPDLLFRSSR
ncbi:uncharacterized protein LOC133180946 [Saccostrea echinata]|uniref:uncharacterized protein LOC133180946 n=1 Tax=Saccostrea echinata TaxID=191078 RepID=UPI002A81278D|nr:uncharacterized protein LOC133180946 [Saccostrea echinata]